MCEMMIITHSKNSKEFQILVRKAVYPCGYIDIREKLFEQQLLPTIAFYSKLNDDEICCED